MSRHVNISSDCPRQLQQQNTLAKP